MGAPPPGTAARHDGHVSGGGDLGGFLKVRRATVTPEEVGLPRGPRRRTPGLRREEVALLAGVSVSWYTWLEQGRPVNASAEVLDAVARVLRLDGVERAHLHALSRRGEAADTADDAPHTLPDAVRSLLDALDPHPAYVLGPSWDYLAWNRAQQRMFPALARLPEPDRNLVWAVFTHPSARALLADGWEAEARRVLSQFRADTAPRRDAPAVRRLVERLTEASPEFRGWWPRHDVAGPAPRLRRFRHPVAGELVFTHLQLTPDAAPWLRVVAHMPAPGDDSAARLARA